MTKFYTSRSSIESYQKCPRYRYLHDYYQGTGIVPKSTSVPLETGTGVHNGVGHLLARIKLTDKLPTIEEVDVACQLAVATYIQSVENVGLYGPGVTLPHQQHYTFNEQIALVEALIRVWAIVEMPLLFERFKVVGVEREIEVPLPDSDVVLQVRVDAELLDRKDGSYFNYSLKTTKQWDERAEKGYKRDLQGVTEIYGIEQVSGVVNAGLEVVDTYIAEVFGNLRNPKLLDIQTYLRKQQLPSKKVMGVKFCFLVKGYFGPKQKNNPESVYHTHSPLIRGYRNIGPTGVGYAHSLYFPNKENDSGWGRLGKGWEQFDVWSDGDWGVKQWVETIASGRIQAECGDVLKGQCVTPVEYFRDEEEILEAIQIIELQEHSIKSALEDLAFNSSHYNPNTRAMYRIFPKHRSSCHYPTDCTYNPICWAGMTGANADVSSDPIGSGLYQIRVPHHKGELEQHKRLKGV